MGPGKRFAAEAGLSGGGGGFASHLCKVLCKVCVTCFTRPATSDEVRRIYRLPPLPPTSLTFDGWMFEGVGVADNCYCPVWLAGWLQVNGDFLETWELGCWPEGSSAEQDGLDSLKTRELEAWKPGS